jgi:hypothetical protein
MSKYEQLHESKRSITSLTTQQVPSDDEKKKHEKGREFEQDHSSNAVHQLSEYNIAQLNRVV